MTRREWLAAGGLGALAIGLPARLRAAVDNPAIGQLAVLSTRPAEIVTWSPRDPRGVVLFSHDANSRPQAHPRLVDLLTAAGFAMLAPVHGEAEQRETSFPARIEDLFAAAAHAAIRYGGLPVIAAGQGYGALIAMCVGGALDPRLRIPAVKAVLALDPTAADDRMIGPDGYRTLAAPLMSVQGVADRAGGGAAPPAAGALPRGSFGITVASGALDAPAAFARAAPAIALFVDGYGLDRSTARRRLRRWVPTAGDSFTMSPPTRSRR